MQTNQVSHEPRLALISLIPKPVIAHCPRPLCRFAASALTEGRAIRSLAAHIVKTHGATRDRRN